MRARVRSRAFAGLLGVLLLAAGPAQRVVAGTYGLAEVAGRPLPLALGGGVVPGEGAALGAASLTLRPDGRFTARVVVLWTDSGTVEMPSTAEGRWRVRADTLVLRYLGTRRPQWCPVRACADSARADTGRITREGLVLRRLAGLGPSALGANQALRLRRAPER